MVQGRMRTFEYKALNLLIQGSSADVTKMAMVDYAREASRDAPLILSVHDELVISCPKVGAAKHGALLKRVMNADRLDTPMLSEGYVGPNWGDLKPCE
jgi:DNA polymerase-1